MNRPPNVNFNQELALTTGNLRNRKGNYRYPIYTEVKCKPDFHRQAGVNYWLAHFLEGTSCTPELHAQGNNLSPLKNKYLQGLRTVTRGDYQKYNDISSDWAYTVLCESEYNQLRTTGQSNPRFWYSHYNFSYDLYDAINFYFWSSRHVSPEDYREQGGSSERHYVLAIRFECFYSFHYRTCYTNFTPFNRLYEDYMLRLDFPLRLSWSEVHTAQVGLLTMHRAAFYHEVNTGNYMRTFHLMRHSVLDYRSPNFIQQHFYDRNRANDNEE